MDSYRTMRLRTHSERKARRKAAAHLFARIEAGALLQSTLRILPVSRLQTSMPHPFHRLAAHQFCIFLGRARLLRILRQALQPRRQLMRRLGLSLDAHRKGSQGTQQQVRLEVAQDASRSDTIVEQLSTQRAESVPRAQ